MSSSLGSAPRRTLCQQSSFAAENTLVTIIPAFSTGGGKHKGQPFLSLLSCPHQQTVGPFVAGLPARVPLWAAKMLHRQQLARIRLPAWLSVEKLTAVLEEERTSGMLTTELPYYYYEIARSLLPVLLAADAAGRASPRAAWILLQDLVALRVDKIRQNFHQLSKETLVPAADITTTKDQYELPMIAVTGIASVELNKVGPFLRGAFSDFGHLTRRTAEEEADPEQPQDQPSKGARAVPKKLPMAPSRLRRFRQ